MWGPFSGAPLTSACLLLAAGWSGFCGGRLSVLSGGWGAGQLPESQSQSSERPMSRPASACTAPISADVDSEDNYNRRSLHEKVALISEDAPDETESDVALLVELPPLLGYALVSAALLLDVLLSWCVRRLLHRFVPGNGVCCHRCCGARRVHGTALSTSASPGGSGSCSESPTTASAVVLADGGNGGRLSRINNEEAAREDDVAAAERDVELEEGKDHNEQTEQTEQKEQERSLNGEAEAEAEAVRIMERKQSQEEDDIEESQESQRVAAEEAHSQRERSPYIVRLPGEDEMSAAERLTREAWVAQDPEQFAVFEDEEQEVKFHRARSFALTVLVKAFNEVYESGTSMMENYERLEAELESTVGENAYLKSLLADKDADGSEEVEDENEEEGEEEKNEKEKGQISGVAEQELKPGLDQEVDTQGSSPASSSRLQEDSRETDAEAQAEAEADARSPPSEGSD